jgi:SAM-dependent methyltransferase
MDIEKQFWNNFWSSIKLENYITRFTCHDKLLTKRLVSWLKEIQTQNKSLKIIMEIGCAYSKNLWILPSSFDKSFHFLGLDYCIEPAIQTSRSNPHTNVKIIVGDLFSSPIRESSVDFIMSFGVIEHFIDPTAYIDICYKLLKPNGRFLAGYPSFEGLTGIIQRRINAKALEYHFSVPAEEMYKKLKQNGFKEIEAFYFGLFNPNMINWGQGSFKRLLMYSAFALMKPLEWITACNFISLPSKNLSSYILATGIKPSL